MSEEIAKAYELLPKTGEVEFDVYKAQLYAQNPNRGKEVFTAMLKQKMFKRRVDVSTRPVKVYLARL